MWMDIRWGLYFQVVGTHKHYMSSSKFFPPLVVGALKPSITFISLPSCSPCSLLAPLTPLLLILLPLTPSCSPCSLLPLAPTVGSEREREEWGEREGVRGARGSRRSEGSERSEREWATWWNFHYLIFSQVSILAVSGVGVGVKIIFNTNQLQPDEISILRFKV